MNIVVVLGLGLATRLLLAYVALTPQSGFASDLSLYARWAYTLAEVGPYHFYTELPWVDYPPGYLYVLWLVGEIGENLEPGTPHQIFMTTLALVKIPPMLCDVLAGFLLYCIVRDVPASSIQNLAIKAAALYLFNPVTIYDSALWGQTDGVGACVMLLAMISLIRWPPEASAGIAVLAAMIKPQFGVILIPIIAVVLLKRHLFVRSEHTGVTDALSRYAGPIRLLTSAAVGLAVFYTIALPFNLNLQSFAARMSTTAGLYSFLSVNAFNPWALFGAGDTPPLIFASSAEFGTVYTWSRDNVPLVGPLTGTTIGTALLTIGFLLGLVRLLQQTDRWSIAMIGFYLSMCFFMLPTRVHERYLFVAFAFLPLLAIRDRKWLWAGIALMIGSLINLHAIVTLPAYGTPDVVHLPFGALCRSPFGALVSITLHIGVFIFAVSRLLQRS